MNDRNTTASSSSVKKPEGILDAAKDRAKAQLSTQKGRATDTVDVLAGAVRQTTDQLRRDQHDTLAHYIDRAAEQLERISDTIRNKDVNELFRDARQLARRQPVVFLGGSFVAGMLLARFLKSSHEYERADFGTRNGDPSHRDPDLLSSRRESGSGSTTYQSSSVGDY